MWSDRNCQTRDSYWEKKIKVEKGASMSPTIVTLTVDQAMERRAAILAELQMQEEVLRDRAAKYQLDAAEIVLFEELEDIDFLLGE